MAGLKKSQAGASPISRVVLYYTICKSGSFRHRGSSIAVRFHILHTIFITKSKGRGKACGTQEIVEYCYNRDGPEQMIHTQYAANVHKLCPQFPQYYKDLEK